MNLAARLAYARANLKPPNRFKRQLLESLGEFAETGSTKIRDKHFSRRDIAELKKFLAGLSLRENIGVIFEDRPDGNIRFVVGDKLHMFPIDDTNSPMAIVLMNCESNAALSPVSYDLLGFGQEKRPIYLMSFIFIEQLERELKAYSNRLLAKVVSELGLAESLNTAVFDTIIGSYSSSKLMANPAILSVDVTAVKEAVRPVFSPRPKCSFLIFLSQCDAKLKKKLLEELHIKSGDQIFKVDDERIRSVSFDFCFSYFKEHYKVSIFDIITPQVIANLLRNVYGEG